MARYDSDWEDEDDTDEVDQEEEGWFELDEALVTVACSNCQRQIYEEAEQCPYCGHFATSEQRQPWWVWLGVLLAGYAIYRWVFG
jgi:hypothetical protein